MINPVKRFFLAVSLLAALGTTCVYAQTVAKYRVAVSDLIVNDSISSTAKKTIVQSSLLTDIENAIRNGRKFELVTRRMDKLQAIRKEQQFAKSGLAANNAAAEGQFDNAQSLVVVEVQDFQFRRNASKVPNIENKYRISDIASIELNVQIIDSSKGSVTGSFSVEGRASSATRVSNGVGSPSQDILNKALDRVAASLANQLSDTIFPITVIQSRGKLLWVNRGGDGGLKLGEQFVIFQPGEVLIDPQTGENLGTAEVEVGKGKVVRINPKVTIVQVIEGDPSIMDRGFILRRPVQSK